MKVRPIEYAEESFEELTHVEAALRHWVLSAHTQRNAEPRTVIAAICELAEVSRTIEAYSYIPF